MGRRAFVVRPAVGTALAAALLCAARAEAQRVAFERVVPAKTRMEGDLKRARLRLGPIRLLPALAFENAGYTNNALGTPEGEPDYRATVRGGAAFVVPLGHQVYLRGDLLPSYDWYAHLTERRAFGGVYGGELGAFTSRVTALLGGSHARSTQFVSSELYQPVPQTEQAARVQVDLELFGRVALVGTAEGKRLRLHPSGDASAEFTRLDNDLRSARAGLRYRFLGRLDVSAQMEATRTTYPRQGGLRDNETTAYLVGIGYDRERFYVNVLGGYREGKPYAGSAFPEYRGPTGSAFVSWFVARRVELQLQARRELTGSLYGTNPYFVATTVGGGLNVRLGHRITLRGFGDASRNTYPLEEEVDGVPTQREDRGRTFGGGLSLRFFRATALSALVSHTRFTSNVPGAERSILAVTTNLSFDVFDYGEQQR